MYVVSSFSIVLFDYLLCYYLSYIPTCLFINVICINYVSENIQKLTICYLTISIFLLKVYQTYTASFCIIAVLDFFNNKRVPMIIYYFS